MDSQGTSKGIREMMEVGRTGWRGRSRRPMGLKMERKATNDDVIGVSGCHRRTTAEKKNEKES